MTELVYGDIVRLNDEQIRTYNYPHMKSLRLMVICPSSSPAYFEAITVVRATRRPFPAAYWYDELCVHDGWMYEAFMKVDDD